MKRLTMWVGPIIFLAITLPAFGQQTGAEFVSPKAEDYFNQGVELYEAQNYNEAITAFEKAIEIKPDYAEACYNLGIIYWQQKQYKKVSEKLQKVLELAPDSDVAKKAEQDIKNLKAAGIFLVGPGEKETEEGEKTSRITKLSEKPNATLPELVEDLRFGPTNKRIAAAKWLGFFPEEEAVKALGEVTQKSGELPEIWVAAVESLGEIALPSAVPFLREALEATDFPTEGKQAAIKALKTINTSESLKAILSAWAGVFPGGLSNQNVVELVREKGKEEFAGIIRPAYLQATGERKIAMALALGILKDATGVPLMVNRLKENYPDDAVTGSSLNQPPQRQPVMAGPPIPGGLPLITPILKEQTAEAEGWSQKDEISLRVEIVEVLGICAGANQKPFLTYLSKNDQEKKVREAALGAVKNLEARVANSAQAYQKGSALAKEGKITEAIPLIQTALKENPDAPYVEEIKKLQARFNYDQALVLLKENKKEEAVNLLRSALELHPEATFRKEAESKLAELQAPVFPGEMGTPLMPGPQGIPLIPPPARK